MAMDWKEEYSTGIDEIDIQHKKLLRHFSMIVEASADQETWGDIHHMASELRKFAEFHFKFEEALMRVFHFPGWETHALVHQSFLNQCDVRLAKSLKEGGDAKDEVLEFLTNWVTNHILKADMEYSKLIQGKLQLCHAPREGVCLA